MASYHLPTRLSRGNLLLRTWTPADAAALTALVERNLEHLRPWVPWIADEPMSVDDRATMLARWERDRLAGGDTVYGIFVDGDRPVGGTGLHRRRGPHGLEIGYWLDADHEGRGIMTRAAALLTDTALTAPGVMFVEIHHDKANNRSAGIPRRLGYRLVDEAPDAVDAAGEVGIDCTWRVTADEWRARDPAPKAAADLDAWPGPPGEIVTDRLVMRPLGTAHLTEMVALYEDPDVTRFLAPLDRAGHRHRLEEAERSWETRGYGRAAVFERSTGAFLGRAGLHYWPQFDEVEASWAFRRAAWGRGYATEAACAWVAWGLARLKVGYITANIHPDNAGSLAVARRLGMAPIRTDVFHGREVVVHAALRA